MTEKRGDPRVTRLVVKTLRAVAGFAGQEEFGRKSRVSQAAMSRFETGESAPTEAELRRMARAAPLEWPVVVHLLRVFTAVRSAADRLASAEEEAAGGEIADVALDAVLLALAPYLIEEAAAPPGPTPEEARREAEQVWAALETFPPHRRRELIELGPPQARTCALMARVCDASARSAAHDPAEALELAALACFLAERAEGGEGRRSRARGYALIFVSNGQRAANDFDGADSTLSRARPHWKAGVAIESDPLAEWRILDLEASLRRAQQRFAESLDLLERARAVCDGSPGAIGRILVKRSNVEQASGNFAAALAALEEAAPAVKDSGDQNLLFSLRFNKATNLVYLQRHDEAAGLLPGIRELADAQRQAIWSTKILWLESRIAVGLGREDEALAGLEQVRDDFTTIHKLPYHAALASLDIAVLSLERGRTAEVRDLAVGMGWIFQAKGIAREALASLKLFCEAARQEAATVELARQVSSEIERVLRTAR
ncbi:MAG TPA: helix-turn-helix transcriptional regulator [Thermoanaerobaculia bacterium]